MFIHMYNTFHHLHPLWPSLLQSFCCWWWRPKEFSLWLHVGNRWGVIYRNIAHYQCLQPWRKVSLPHQPLDRCSGQGVTSWAPPPPQWDVDRPDLVETMCRITVWYLCRTHHHFSRYFHPLLFSILWASEWVVQVSLTQSTQESCLLLTVTLMSSKVTSAHYRNEFLWPKLAGSPHPRAQ